jgi:hypothetical protein
MSKNTIPAAAEGMTKIDRSTLMKLAWDKYRDFRRRYGAWQIERGIVDASLSNCLKIAWRILKQKAADAVATAKEAALDGTAIGAQIAALRRAAIETQFLSFRFDAAAERRKIETQIEALLASA